jgi:Tol biopolymer transport system component
VAFTADRDTDGKQELYVVNPAGGLPVKVSGPLIAQGDVLETFVWASDNVHLAYVADANLVLKLEVFVTTITGGAIRVSPASMDDQGGADEIEFRPGSTRLAFRADLDADADFEVSMVDANGGNLVTVSGLGTQHAMHWAPNGGRLAFLNNSTGNTQDRLFTILPGGTGITEVSALALGANPASSSVTGYAWSNEGSKLGFLADRDINERFELHTVPAAGGTVINVSAVPVSTDVLDFQWSPTTLLLAYRVNDSVNFLPELWVVFDTGIGKSELADADGQVGIGLYKWSPSGNRVAYTADHVLDNAMNLWIVTVLGPPVADAQLSTGILPFQGVHAFEWSPDSTRLLYTSDQDITGVDDVYFGIVDGPIPVQKSAAPDAAHEAIQIGWTTNGLANFWIAGNGAGPRRLFQGDENGGLTLTITSAADTPALSTGPTGFETR